MENCSLRLRYVLHTVAHRAAASVLAHLAGLNDVLQSSELLLERYVIRALQVDVIRCGPEQGDVAVRPVHLHMEEASGWADLLLCEGIVTDSEATADCKDFNFFAGSGIDLMLWRRELW